MCKMLLAEIEDSDHITQSCNVILCLWQLCSNPTLTENRNIISVVAITLYVYAISSSFVSCSA